MASTTALFTGLTGLISHSSRLDTIGNNIANVNTVGFKGSRLVFQNQFSITSKIGSPPSADVGGSNPFQVGLGVTRGTSQRDFRVGSLSPTGDPRDLAIDGDGMFIVRRNGEDFYSRNGAFRVDSGDRLTGPGGELLLGYTVNDNFQIQEGTLSPISLPVGRLRISEATTEVVVAGNIDAGGDVAQTGGLTQLRATITDGLRLIDPLAGGFPAAPPASAASLLVNLADPSLPLPTTALFSAGQTIELEGAQRGGRALPVATLDITATTTVQDLLTFFDTAMGIHSLTSTNPDGASPGSTIDPATGVISIVSNTGEAADLTIDAANLRLLNADGSLSRLPFVPTDSADASGESGRTTMVAYDSLGNVVTFDVSFTLVSKNGGNGTTWRYDIESSNNAGGNLFVQSGTLQFDTQGRIVDPAPVPVSIGRTGTGSVDPLVFNLRFTGAQGELTALVDTPSEFSSIARNGLPAGTLERWSIGADGVVAGSFSNGAVRTLGRVVLASFTNYEGLVDLGGGLFRPGGNSGEAAIVTPGSAGTGGILSGSLELSNVDLGQEFIDLILTSTGYTASSRVIQTTDELIQQLLLIGR